MKKILAALATSALLVVTLATAAAAAAIASASPRYSARSGWRFASSSYTRGAPVGILSSVISCSEMPSSILTSALRLLPWAAINTFLPASSSGAIAAFQYTSTRSSVGLSPGCPLPR